MAVKPQTSSRYGNSAASEEFSWLSAITTTNATPTLYFSIPIVQNKAVTLYLEYDAVKTDYTLSTGGYIVCKFTRGTGNIVQQGTHITDIIQGFNGSKPFVTITANVLTQSIDVSVVGILLTNILWTADYYLKFNP